MVKRNTQKELNYSDFLKVFYNFNLFANKFNLKKLFLYNIFLIIIFFIEFLLKEHFFGSGFPISEIILLSVFGLPFVLFLFFLLFYIFLNAYENKRKPFFESFLVYTAIIYPYIIIGNLFGWLLTSMSNIIIITIFTILIFLIYLHFLISFVLNFRSYYKSTNFKIIASILTSTILFLMISFMQYMFYIINALSQNI